MRKVFARRVAGPALILPSATATGARDDRLDVRLASITSPVPPGGPDRKVQRAWRILPGMHSIGIRAARVECPLGDRSGAIDTTFDVRS